MTALQIAPGLSLRDPEPRPRLTDFKLIAFDMDSTLLAIETLDELADLAGRKAEVAALTEAAMQGEALDYATSLRRRVALLAGLPAQAIDQIWNERARLTPGAAALVQACQAAGLRCILTTGGFTCFTERLAAQLRLDDVRANVLEIVDGRITGRLLDQPGSEGLCDGEAKKAKVLQTCAAMGITPAQAITVGDGANDLAMMSVAGLSVAYRAKPVVRAQARVAIDSGGLDRLLAVFAG